MNLPLFSKRSPDRRPWSGRNVFADYVVLHSGELALPLTRKHLGGVK
jgi:hypothetical protein